MKSFKELLLRKVRDNQELEKFINFLGEDLITEAVIESLQKMGQHGQNESKGRKVNPALMHFAKTMTKRELNILRDAISHHLSHYRAALLRGDRKTADEHIARAFPMLDLAARAAKNSGGLFSFKAINPMAWEMNYTTNERNPDGEWIRDPGGWKTRASKRGVSSGQRSIPDYRFLEMPPHAGHHSHADHSHRGGYPFEEIQIGHDEDIHSNKAHLYHKEVDPNVKEFVPHPFDHHPINQLFDVPTSRITDEMLHNYISRSEEWNNSHHPNTAIEMMKPHVMSAHKAGGFHKPSHFYEKIELLPQPEEARKYKYKELLHQEDKATPSSTKKITSTSSTSSTKTTAEPTAEAQPSSLKQKKAPQLKNTPQVDNIQDITPSIKDK